MKNLMQVWGACCFSCERLGDYFLFDMRKKRHTIEPSVSDSGQVKTAPLRFVGSQVTPVSIY